MRIYLPCPAVGCEMPQAVEITIDETTQDGQMAYSIGLAAPRCRCNLKDSGKAGLIAAAIAVYENKLNTGDSDK